MISVSVISVRLVSASSIIIISGPPWAQALHFEFAQFRLRY